MPSTDGSPTRAKFKVSHLLIACAGLLALVVAIQAMRPTRSPATPASPSPRNSAATSDTADSDVLIAKASGESDLSLPATDPRSAELQAPESNAQKSVPNSKSAAKTVSDLRALEVQFAQDANALIAEQLVKASIAVILDSADRFQAVEPGKATQIPRSDWHEGTDMQLLIHGRRYAVAYAEFPVLRALREHSQELQAQPLPADLVLQITELQGKAEDALSR